jgi:hypothetical protein
VFARAGGKAYQERSYGRSAGSVDRDQAVPVVDRIYYWLGIADQDQVPVVEDCRPLNYGLHDRQVITVLVTMARLPSDYR